MTTSAPSCPARLRLTLRGYFGRQLIADSLANGWAYNPPEDKEVHMSEVATDFQSLPEEYQLVIRLAEETHKIAVAPLQLLVGGWSGAAVYLVSVSNNDTKRVQHCILKVDRKGKGARSDEVTRHNTVMTKSPPEFARDHIAELVFDRVEHEDAIAIFYRIAGQSLLKYRPLSNYERQNQLRTIFSETNKVLLTEWNSAPAFEAIHPQKVLQKWLGFRLDSGGSIESFLQDTCRVDPDTAGLLINGHLFPNPLCYARKAERWGKARSIDIASGFIHGDLNTNNILVKFSEDKESLEGYYLIDFALFKDRMPLFYDQRYLEMSYLTHAISRISFAKCIDFLTLLAVADVPDPHKVPIEMSGVSTVIGSARNAFGEWVQDNHPSLHDDLWGQYWLAGVASGLSYCHKLGMSDEQRLAGLIYAATNLKRYAATFNVPAPTNVEPLYDANQADSDSSAIRRPKHNLPAQPTPFIGRQSELAAVKELLIRDQQYVRLVTLTGPGGTGKTRLAVQAAAELVDHFGDGVYFVDLAPIREPEAVLTTIARTVGIRDTSDRPVTDELKGQLQSKAMLLLLDNFEQVTAAAPKVGDLLQACSRLKLLVTSREPLHLRGEQIHPVPPLALPRADLKQQSLEQLTQYEAVRLFIDRVMAVKPDFEVTDDNAAVVTDICFRLDGLPLAIELAAARIRVFSPRALLERLGGRLQVLRGGARDLPLRQQALRDTIDWSYELLGGGEQRLFALLSVFAGCTFEAVEAVASGMRPLDGMGLDVLEGVASLLDKSLIRQTDQDTGESRLLMLETIREYATERLDQDPEFGTAAHQAHAIYFAEFAQRQWKRLSGDGREAALREMESDIENLRIASHYWVERKDLEQLNKFVNSLLLLYDARGWYHATVGLTNDLLNVLAATPSTPERVEQQIMLQTSLARAVMATKGYTEEAEQAYVRALELVESAGEVPQLFPVLRGLASLYNFRNQPDKAMQLGERMLDLADRLGDVDMKIEGLLVTGYNLAFGANPQRGLELIEAAIALSSSQRRPPTGVTIGPNPAVVSLNVSALFLWTAGYPDRAYNRAAEAIALAQKLNHPYSLTYAQFHHGLLHMWLRNYEIARDSAQAVVQLAEVYGFQIWNAIGSCLRGAALVNIGGIAEGLALAEQGLKAYRGLKTPPVFWPLLLHLCAAAYGAASRPEDGLPLLDEAIAAEKGNASSSDSLSAEFLVLKGDLLLAISSDNTADAEFLYQSAVKSARAVGAAMVELQAAMRLSRLWQNRGELEQARELLSAAYSKITEGFTTADMKDATALLDTLTP
jgi:predicted ATPase